MDTKFDLKKEKTIATDLKELVLWYDEVINLESSIKTIIDVCGFSEKEATNIALDSLLDGSAKITAGKNDKLIKLQNTFKKRLINTTII
jgi:hypothetical protein